MPSDVRFKAKMNKIRFPLRAPPQTPLGAYNAPPPSYIYGGLLLRGGRGKGERNGKGVARPANILA